MPEQQHIEKTGWREKRQAKARQRQEAEATAQAEYDEAFAALKPDKKVEYTAEAQRRFEKHRDELLVSHRSNVEKQDNLKLTISSAALGVSASFVNAFPREKHIVGLTMLHAAWWLLIGSIVSVLCAYHFANVELPQAIKDAEMGMVKRQLNKLDAISRWARLRGACDTLSSITFATGLLALIWFLVLNTR